MAEQSFDLILRGGDVVTTDGRQRLDAGVRDGRIAALAPELSAAAPQTIDARGHLVFPGFIDAHTHMGIPIKATTSADDFLSGSTAAAFGGVTTILDFTVQSRGQSLSEAVEARGRLAAGRSRVDYGLHVNVTDRPEQHLDEIPRLIDAGFSSFKVFSTYREAGMMIEWGQFRSVLKQVAAHGGLLMLHAEDDAVVETATAQNITAGHRAPIYHARSRPPEAEAQAISQAAVIAGELDAPLYIVHLSSAAGLEAALRAREAGVRLYLETCPHYLLLNEEQYQGEQGHYFITTPPLRRAADSEALWRALADGQIDVVATDHCPFTAAQKESAGGLFHQTPNGLPGVETLFPLLYSYGVAGGRISLSRMVELLAANPARLFGLAGRKGAIQIGADADLVVWDPRGERTLTAAQTHGNADWSPFEGLTLSGRLAYTILRGRILVAGEQLVAPEPAGKLLPAAP